MIEEYCVRQYLVNNFFMCGCDYEEGFGGGEDMSYWQFECFFFFYVFQRFVMVICFWQDQMEEV